MIKNMTPHDVVLLQDDRKTVFPRTKDRDEVPRVEQVKGGEKDVQGVPLTRCSFRVNNLPPRQKNVLYIVSSMVLQYSLDRDDFIAPDTSDSPLDRDKRPTGVYRFIQFANKEYQTGENIETATISSIIKEKNNE